MKLAKVELAVQDKSLPTVTVTREVTAALTIYIPGIGLPLIVRNAKMVVSDMEMSSILLGRDIRDHLGFTFTKYLSDNYKFVRDTDANTKVRASAYTGVVYTETSMMIR